MLIFPEISGTDYDLPEGSGPVILFLSSGAEAAEGVSKEQVMGWLTFCLRRQVMMAAPAQEGVGCCQRQR